MVKNWELPLKYSRSEEPVKAVLDQAIRLVLKEQDHDVGFNEDFAIAVREKILDYETDDAAMLFTLSSWKFTDKEILDETRLIKHRG